MNKKMNMEVGCEGVHEAGQRRHGRGKERERDVTVRYKGEHTHTQRSSYIKGITKGKNMIARLHIASFPVNLTNTPQLKPRPGAHIAVPCRGYESGNLGH